MSIRIDGGSPSAAVSPATPTRAQPKERLLMLKFDPFSLETLKKAIPYLKNNPWPASDITAGVLLMFREGTELGFCIENDTLIVRQIIGDQVAFSWPIGADVDGAIDKLIVYARENSLPLRFYGVTKELLRIIRADGRLRPAMWGFDMRWSDYVYSFDEIASFRGKKFSGQRNHINKFVQLYGEPVVRAIRPEDRDKIDAMLREYHAEHDGGTAIEAFELAGTLDLLDSYEDLGMIAACLEAGGEIAAVSIGELVGDMLFIHVEKALKRFEGAYPVIFNGFVRYVEAQLGYPLLFVNREDDSGDPGIRTSKRQYQPISMINKHLVHVKAGEGLTWDFMRHRRGAVLRCGDVFLTPVRASDKAAYLALNTDVDNNKMWGYDYREDPWITGPVDDNTFYDQLRRDMRAGDSINFAVRTSESGPMIGEALLWQFTSDGFAEVGCRIMPEYHQKGYGKAAFSGLSEFASRELGLKCVARCFAENEASRRMIEGSGYSQIRQDGKNEIIKWRMASDRRTE